ncbi:hypothetical protein CSUI_010083 [Cystoisospora suis]|uniref:Uncharacterized protein n=1 Tax=Cystoisospora suis TaxID=483139 RepID=A0A2C6KHW1_9APIC|nr:hypothetical protein CSUI_010083 [Cystoisospora suis]
MLSSRPVIPGVSYCARKAHVSSSLQTSFSQVKNEIKRKKLSSRGVEIPPPVKKTSIPELTDRLPVALKPSLSAPWVASKNMRKKGQRECAYSFMADKREEEMAPRLLRICTV